MACDPGALVAVFAADEAWVDDGAVRARFVAEASCAPPIDPRWLPGARIEAREGPRGELDVHTTSPAWVTVDGSRVPLPVGLLPGQHLVQVGPEGSVAAWGAALIDIRSGERADLHVALQADGAARIYGCEEREIWLEDLEVAAHGAGAEDGEPLVALQPAMSECAGTTGGDRWRAAVAGVELGARSGSEQISAEARGRALAVDAVAWREYEREKRSAARWSSLGAPVGLAIAGAGVFAHAEGRPEAGRALAVGGAATLLASTALQRARMVESGQAAPGAGSGVGALLLGGACLFQEDTGVLLWSGAVTSGVVQWIVNERAMHAKRRRS